MPATLTPNRLGTLQMGALDLLVKRKRMTAVEIRNAIGPAHIAIHVEPDQKAKHSGIVVL